MTEDKRKVVTFAQPSKQTAPFRHGQPLTEEVVDAFLPELYNEFVSFIVDRVGGSVPTVIDGVRGGSRSPGRQTPRA
ncbi:hypothetical protein VKA52_10965 [Halobacillus sp. HZG1]|uniref:hypothetical protein n=1 Tax=Halobacillus sp. HZG1 TaxID=3111769 RepID=UPI002DBB835B|nr:hypothetical protein [Halobacillus sp. HZG1]MEC3884248.1 hypothetical protein [Halobacillus sp. HZG1]